MIKHLINEDRASNGLNRQYGEGRTDLPRVSTSPPWTNLKEIERNNRHVIFRIKEGRKLYVALNTVLKYEGAQ